MKKITAILIISLILIFLSINISLAFKWEINYPFGNPSPDLPSYINSIYKIAFFLGSFLAVLMIVVAGIQWATPTSNPSVKVAAKKRLTNAIIGLVLLFAMYLVLKAINPDILILKDLNVQKPTSESDGPARGNTIDDQIVRGKYKLKINWHNDDIETAILFEKITKEDSAPLLQTNENKYYVKLPRGPLTIEYSDDKKPM